MGEDVFDLVPPKPKFAINETGSEKCGYRAIEFGEDWPANQTLLAFVRVMNITSGKDEQAFESFVVEEPNILECHDISGEDSYMLKIRTDSPASLRRLLSRIREFPGVERTMTSISLCTIKESGGPPLPVRPNGEIVQNQPKN